VCRALPITYSRLLLVARTTVSGDRFEGCTMTRMHRPTDQGYFKLKATRYDPLII
jgi:hypothetical protein